MSDASSETYSDNQIRGHKANLSNPTTSEESKQHSMEIIDSLDGATASGNKQTGEPASEHDNRVLGGHKATLKNPNASEEAKDHSKEVLEEAGQATE